MRSASIHWLLIVVLALPGAGMAMPADASPIAGAAAEAAPCHGDETADAEPAAAAAEESCCGEDLPCSCTAVCSSHAAGVSPVLMQAPPAPARLPGLAQGRHAPPHLTALIRPPIPTQA